MLLEQLTEIGFIKGIARFMKIGAYHMVLFLIPSLFVQNFDFVQCNIFIKIDILFIPTFINILHIYLNLFK